MAYTHEVLIDQSTGEYDWTAIKRWSLIRADREYGGPGAPISWVRDAIRWHKGYAEIMRKRWREEHGLVDDTKYVMVAPYGKQQTGVRRSAF